MAEEIKSIFDTLDELLAKTRLDDVTAESSGYETLPEGYYLCEVEKTTLGSSKTSGNPMVSFQLKVVEDGHKVGFDGNGNVSLEDIPHTKGRKIFKHYPFKDESSVKRFATDMLKFEDENGSILPKEAFTTSDVLNDALEILEGMNIYVQMTNNEKDDGTVNSWANLISWKRASLLELPIN